MAPNNSTLKPDEVPDKSTAAPAVETPDESPRASINTKTVWPTSVFRVESVPEITSEGTMLTATQLKTAEEAAAKSGVVLVTDKEGGSN